MHMQCILWIPVILLRCYMKWASFNHAGSVGSWLSFLLHDVTGKYHVGIDLAGVVVDEFPVGEKSPP